MLKKCVICRLAQADLVKYGLIILCCFRVLSMFSQLDNTSLFFNREVDTTREKEAYIKLQSLGYMKNNEYYGYIADGYTLFGVQLNPQLGYQLSKNMSIEAGVFLQKDFGNKKFINIDPTFSLRYSKKDFKMVFGNLDGSLNHQLIEPLYNFERLITNRLESGAQFILNKRRYDFDVWVDWQNMIYRGSSGQEKIWGGLNANLLKLKNDKLEFRLPLQVSLLHTGGQIDTSNSIAYTNWNAAAGFLMKYNIGKKYLQNLLLDARYVGRVNYRFLPAEQESHGYGFLGNIGFTALETDVMLSYWHGYNYISDLGGYLYSSQSSAVAYSYIYETNRDLLFLRLTKRIRLADHVLLTLRVEPYYDLRMHWLEYSYGFYISIDEHIWFKKKTNP